MGRAIRLGLLVVAVGAAGALMSQRAGRREGAGERYVHPGLGFAVTAPEGWSLREAGAAEEAAVSAQAAGLVLVITEEPRGRAEPFTANITIAVRGLPADSQLEGAEEAIGYARRLLSSLPLAADPGSDAAVEPAGLPGARREFHYVQRHEAGEVAVSAAVTALVSLQRGRCLLITGSARSEAFARYRRVFRKCVESVEEI